MLSKENKEKIFMNGLYMAEPKDLKDDPASGSCYWNTSGAYHCRSWNFYPYECDDGTVFMVDTYWSTGDNARFKVTDDNVDKFKCLMEDTKDWKKIDERTAGDYANEDIVRTERTASRDVRFYKRIGAVPVPARQIARAKRKLVNEMSSALRTWDVNWALRELKEAMNGVDIAAFDQASEYAEMDEYLSSRDKMTASEHPSLSQFLTVVGHEISAIGEIGYYFVEDYDEIRIFNTVTSTKYGDMDAVAVPDKSIIVFVTRDAANAGAISLCYENYQIVKNMDSFDDCPEFASGPSFGRACADAAEIALKAQSLIDDIEALQAKYN